LTNVVQVEPEAATDSCRGGGQSGLDGDQHASNIEQQPQQKKALDSSLPKFDASARTPPKKAAVSLATVMMVQQQQQQQRSEAAGNRRGTWAAKTAAPPTGFATPPRRCGVASCDAGA
jgi:hypothetical protein